LFMQCRKLPEHSEDRLLQLQLCSCLFLQVNPERLQTDRKAS